MKLGFLLSFLLFALPLCVLSATASIFPDTTPPSAITTLFSAGPMQHSVSILWTATGDDGNEGTASNYDLRYSTMPITAANFNSAIQVIGEPAPQVAGTLQVHAITGLNPSTTYYFAIKVSDEVPNWSVISNVVAISTAPISPSPTPSPTPTPLSQLYPCDIGIQNDPSVIFAENFEESSISALSMRWNSAANTDGMAFSFDRPAASSGFQSLEMTATGGLTTGGYLFKNFAPAGYDTIYVRYYVKLPAAFNGLNHLPQLGGNNPAMNFPVGSAGIKPTGSDRFSTALEFGNPNEWDFYTYWMNMRSWGAGQYYGNSFNPSPSVPLQLNSWIPVEYMIKLNNPVSSYNGEQAFWTNGILRQHLKQGSPLGSWSMDEFYPSPSGTPFEGFQWRNNDALKINYLWFQYYDALTSAGVTDRIWFDDLVVATRPIGPINCPVISPSVTPWPTPSPSINPSVPACTPSRVCSSSNTVRITDSSCRVTTSSCGAGSCCSGKCYKPGVANPCAASENNFVGQAYGGGDQMDGSKIAIIGALLLIVVFAIWKSGMLQNSAPKKSRKNGIGKKKKR